MTLYVGSLRGRNEPACELSALGIPREVMESLCLKVLKKDVVLMDMV